MYYYHLNPVGFYSYAGYSKMIYYGKRGETARRCGECVCVSVSVSPLELSGTQK